ncbi:MAG TPA: hypothetical protein VFO40_00795 [Chthoniobacterales bacterium]|nr:hypothetical protein [Chthoniobacterales bacterium]
MWDDGDQPDAKDHPKPNGWKFYIAMTPLVYVLLFVSSWLWLRQGQLTHRSRLLSSPAEIAVFSAIGTLCVVIATAFDAKRR